MAPLANPPQTPTDPNLAVLDDPLGRWPQGFVYAAQLGNTGDVKIGHSHQPRQRITEFSLPDKIHLRWVLPGTMQFERYLHNYFKALRKRGEWFGRPDIILPELASIAQDLANLPDDRRAYCKMIVAAVRDGRLPRDYWRLTRAEIHRRILWPHPLLKRLAT